MQKVLLPPPFSRHSDTVSYVLGTKRDLPSTLTVHQVAETRSKIDCPINDADAILQIMFTGRHISVNWTIMGWSSLCYLMKGLDLMGGRCLVPKCAYSISPSTASQNSVRYVKEAGSFPSSDLRSEIRSDAPTGLPFSFRTRNLWKLTVYWVPHILLV